MTTAFRPAILACLLTLLAGCHSNEESQKPPVKAGGDLVRIDPASPKRSYIHEADVVLSQRPLMEPVTGKLGYDETRTARVSSPISGRVTDGIAELGRRVAKDDVLVELDSPELGQARADDTKARADLRLAEHTFNRLKALFDDGVAPRKELEQAQDEMSRARSEAERTRLRLANLGAGATEADSRFRLHAPIPGIVTERHITPGMEVHPDLSDPLFVISDLSRLVVLMDLFEKDLRLIHVGQQVSVRVPAFPDEKFIAKVSYIGQLVDDTTRTVTVRCVLDNPAGRLLPAMYASLEPLSDTNDRAVVVPLTALFTESQSDWVFVAAGDGEYRKRQVEVGLRLRDRAVIVSGLSPGDRLVTDGALLLRNEEDTGKPAREPTS